MLKSWFLRPGFNASLEEVGEAEKDVLGEMCLWRSCVGCSRFPAWWWRERHQFSIDATTALVLGLLGRPVPELHLEKSRVMDCEAGSLPRLQRLQKGSGVRTPEAAGLGHLRFWKEGPKQGAGPWAAQDLQANSRVASQRPCIIHILGNTFRGSGRITKTHLLPPKHKLRREGIGPQSPESVMPQHASSSQETSCRKKERPVAGDLAQ